MTSIDIGELTRQSHLKIKDYMEEIDKLTMEVKENELTKCNYRVYKNRNILENSSKNAYVTSVFINESYIPSALVLAKNMKLLKHKYPLVCMVQDKSYKIDKNGNIEYFHGVSEKGIKDLLELYDMVIGVDLLKVNNYTPSQYHFTNNDSYSNIIYYVTKGQVLGLTMFEKIMYLDASAYVENNIDSIFNNKEGTFLGDNEFEYTQVGIHGAFFFVLPSKYYYHKFRAFISNYNKYFSDLYFMRGVDELVIYYAVYPHWSNTQFDRHFACRKNKRGAFKDCDIYHFQMDKPFRNNDNNDSMKKIKKHYKQYDDWDKLVKILLKSHPNLGYYFQHIKTFRQTLF